MKKKLPRLIESAVRHEGVIYTGRRHCDATRKAYAATGRTVRGTQGFVDESGAFLTREDAQARALQTGQLAEPVFILTSEDLW